MTLETISWILEGPKQFMMLQRWEEPRHYDHHPSSSTDDPPDQTSYETSQRSSCHTPEQSLHRYSYLCPDQSLLGFPTYGVLDEPADGPGPFNYVLALLLDTRGEGPPKRLGIMGNST